MGAVTCILLALLVFLPCSTCAPNRAPYDWFGRDTFDTIMSKYSKVDGTNCRAMDMDELVMPKEAVSMVPQSNQLLDVNTRVFRNRTCLLGLHDLALSRGYFFSYLFKVVNETGQFWMQPGMQYYYWRLASFVTAFPGCVNGSSIEFDYNVTYPNWLTTVPFNTTIEFFAPRATRNLDFSANRFWEIGPSMNRVNIVDTGVGQNRNYTAKTSRTANIRYSKWLPDLNPEANALKGSYTVGVKYSGAPGKWVDDTFKTHTFFGPPLTRLQDNVNLPVTFTQPYFDCGGRNVWMYSAVVPIVDAIPRYRRWQEIIEFGETPPR